MPIVSIKLLPSSDEGLGVVEMPEKDLLHYQLAQYAEAQPYLKPP
jgi:hypothetical protein